MGMRFSLVVVLALAPGVAQAQDGTDAALLEPGTVQLELDVAVPDDGCCDLAPVVAVGLADGLDVAVEGVVSTRSLANPPRRETQLVDDQVALRMRLGRIDALTIATELALLLPELGGDTGVGVGSTAVAQLDFERLALWSNAGLERTRSGRLGMSGLLGAGIVATPGLTLVLEVDTGAMLGSDAATVGGLAGLVWTVAEGLDLRTAARFDREGGETTREVRVGAALALP